MAKINSKRQEIQNVLRTGVREHRGYVSRSRGQPGVFEDFWQAPEEPTGLNSCGSEGECIDFVEFHDFC